MQEENIHRAIVVVQAGKYFKWYVIKHVDVFKLFEKS